MSTPARPKRPGLEQVAERAGVSRATVSRVVNGKTFVDAGLRDRVMAAVDELGYEPNLAARALASGRTDTITLVVSEPDERVFGDPFFARIVRGVTAEANAAGLQVVLMMAPNREGLTRIERYVGRGTTDGVLLISEHINDDPIPPAVVRADMPLVIGGRPYADSPDVLYVDNDNVHGARLATRHLMARGRQRIATLAGPPDMTVGIDRRNGFRLELGDHFDEGLVEYSDFTQSGGEAATDRLLARAPDIDAIFAASDLMALGAMTSIRRCGRQIPRDVAVIGFDDIHLAASTCPPLTTIRQHTELQGRAMVRLLLTRIRPDLGCDALDGVPDLRGADHLVLPVELVLRASA